MNKFARRSVAGFTLIEVMVSLIVFSAGLLGIIGLLVISVKANSSSYIKQQATQAANDIIDRMHSTCTAAQMTTYDLWYWATNEVALLPNGCASITSSVSGLNTLITVTVQWDDTATEGKLGASTSASVTGHPNLAQISVQTLL
jgi:type IV pilus assembly protein PilV